MKTVKWQKVLKLASIGILCFAIFGLAKAITAQGQSHKCSILVGTPIRQKPAILREFLDSLERLDQTAYELSYFFVDDNEIEESKKILQQFAEKHGNRCQIYQSNESADGGYFCDENTHIWKESIIWKVARFKDRMIEHARTQKYDYLFLIDSDIVLHPKTIDQLISTNKEIISNIFWTSWRPDSPLLPQVWMSDEYTQYTISKEEKLSDEESLKRLVDFLMKMRTPGTYQVGGLGACTLINKEALSKDISFRKIENLSFRGEDRHFCVRAVALGLDLFVDTHYPAFHIYRESALPDVEHFKHSFTKIPCFEKNQKPRITLSMIMKNEADRYLRRVLEDAKKYITDAVIIDDASTDNSVAICEEILKDIPLKIVKNKESLFSNEIVLRKQQWEETVKTNPDWIVFLDADQIFEEKFHEGIHELILSPHVDAFYFRLYDFWDENHYREDEHWQAQNRHRIFLVRYRPDIPYVWHHEKAQHCGSYPTTIWKLIGGITSLRLKHYGWAKEEDRIAKYERYRLLDPDAKYGIKEQYDSILDSDPNLVAWVE